MKLKEYLIPLAVVAVLGLLFAVSWVAQRHLEDVARAKVGSALDAILRSTEHSLDAWVKGRTRAVTLVARDPRLAELIQTLQGTDSTRQALRDAPTQAAIRELLKPLYQLEGALGFLIVGPNGGNLAAERVGLVGGRSALEEQRAFLDEVRRGHAGISHPQRARIALPNAYGVPQPGLATLFAAATVRDGSGTALAVLAFRLDPRRGFSSILQRGRLGVSGETYAFDAQGRMLSESRFDRELREIGLLGWDQGSMLTIRIRDPGVDLASGMHSTLPGGAQPLTRMAVSAIQGERGQDLDGYRDYRGQSVVGAWAWLPELRMGVATEVDKAEAFELLQTSRDIINAVTLATAAMILVLALLAHRSQRRIAAGEGRLRAILDNSPALVAVKDLEGRYREVNSAFLHSLQRDAGEVLAKTDFELFTPAEADRLRQHDKDMLKAGEALEFEENLRFGGEARHFLAIHFPLRGSGGQVRAVGIVATDISERIHSEQALRELNQGLEERVAQRTREAEEANHAKSAFLASMSHEIRNPMNVIMGLSQLALKDELRGRPRDYVRRIHNAAQSLLGLINDILDFSKIEAGRLELEVIEFSLHDEVLDNISNVVGLKAAEKGLDLIFDTAPDVPDGLVGDPLRLSQVLINLSDNAVKFTEEGEVRVVIRVMDTVDTGQITLRFEVSDTGIGMTRDQVGRIFEAFSQAEVSMTREHGGTGLGLAICRQLVGLMGGEIGVQSEPGLGSTFWFTARFGRATGLAARPRGLPDELLGTRTLVVDDNAAAREVLVRQLQALGLEAEQAVSGMAAIDQIQTAAEDHPYRLILMDWKMPGMDGVEAARVIRQDLELETVPATIMVSAYGREELMREAGDLQLEGCLIKPVRESTLVAAITEAFGIETGDDEVAEGSDLQGPAARFAGTRVLVVEDNEDSRQVLQEILRMAGIHVELASNGREAVQRVATQSFDGVLMDIEMPEMDGYEATRQIRQTFGSDELPIIAVTANAMSGDRERCLEAGMNDYLAKPIDSRRLYQILAQWLPAGSAQAASGAGGRDHDA